MESLFVLVAFIIGICFGFFVVKNKKIDKAVYDELSQQKQTLEIEIGKIKATMEQKDINIVALQKTIDNAKERENNILKEKEEIIIENSTLKANVNAIKELKEKMLADFKNISNDTLAQQTKLFNANQAEILKTFETKNQDTLLKPLKEKFESFNKEIGEIKIQHTKTQTEITTQIKTLLETTTEIGKKADNFVDIFKGDKKKQGIIGEWELENVLDIMGLQEGTDYEKQKQEVINGEKIIPDFVIHITGEKNLIIDAKCSYINYENYCTQKDDKYLKEYYNDVKAQIDNISKKDYTNLTNSYEFIIVFLAVESAYLDLVKYDKDIVKYAMQKNIGIATQSSLLPLLRMIINLRNIEKQNKNINEIVKYATNIYEDLESFQAKIEKIGNILDKAKEEYEDAKHEITKGGGVLSYATKMVKFVGKKKIKNSLDLLEDD
ncbi:MAG: hypothetical protein Ta2D_01300 [Rickettsiales bacterium]|nr:MAG: hypothetical protein Ta2D_01300 [Rickettsiales bacterium]